MATRRPFAMSGTAANAKVGQPPSADGGVEWGGWSRRRMESQAESDWNP